MFTDTMETLTISNMAKTLFFYTVNMDLFLCLMSLGYKFRQIMYHLSSLQYPICVF